MKATLSSLRSYVKFRAIQALFLKAQCCGFSMRFFKAEFMQGWEKAASGKQRLSYTKKPTFSIAKEGT